MYTQENVQYKCISLIIDTFLYYRVNFDSNLEVLKIYFILNCPHIHRSYWECEDIIIFVNEEEFFDVLVNKYICHFTQMDNIELVPPLEIFDINLDIIKRVENLKSFW